MKPFDPQHMDPRAAAVIEERFLIGDAVEVRDAYNRWLPRIVRSYTLRGYKFPVIFVSRFPDSEPVAWPSEDVRACQGG